MENKAKETSVLLESIIRELAELNLQLLKEYRQHDIKVAPEFFQETRENILFLMRFFDTTSFK